MFFLKAMFVVVMLTMFLGAALSIVDYAANRIRNTALYLVTCIFGLGTLTAIGVSIIHYLEG